MYSKRTINYRVGCKIFQAIYSYGHHFNIITEYQSLTYLFRIKNASSQLMQLRLLLSDYDYNIIYRIRLTHLNVDCLSCIKIIQPNFNNYNNSDLIHFQTPKIFFFLFKSFVRKYKKLLYE